MGYNGSGVYTLPAGTIVSDGTSADAADINTPFEDLEDSMNLAFLRDGRAPATGNFPMGTNKITGLGSGTAATDAAALSQVQTGVVSHATTVGGTADAIEIAFSPANTAWTSKEIIRWTSGGANTVTNPTISKDAGSTTKTIKKGASAALAVGDTGASGYICEAVYNGTDLILLNPATVNISIATAAQFRANTADKVLDTDGVWSAAEPVALTDADPVAVDMSAGVNFKLTIGGNRTLGQPTNQKKGQSGVITITQDGTGSRTLAFHSSYKWPGGTDGVLSTAAGAKDSLKYYVHDTDVIELSLAKGLA